MAQIDDGCPPGVIDAGDSLKPRLGGAHPAVIGVVGIEVDDVYAVTEKIDRLRQVPELIENDEPCMFLSAEYRKARKRQSARCDEPDHECLPVVDFRRAVTAL